MKKIRSREIFSNSRFKLIAIERIAFRYSKSNGGGQIYLNLEPIAVIVVSPNTSYAFDMEANLTTVEKIRDDIPELDSIISELSGQ